MKPLAEANAVAKWRFRKRRPGLAAALPADKVARRRHCQEGGERLDIAGADRISGSRVLGRTSSRRSLSSPAPSRRDRLSRSCPASC
jgi:hypothetical protein